MKIAAVVAILLAWTSCTEQSCFANGQRSTDERSPLNFDLVESFVLASPVASVHRYTAASYAANDPNEDRYVVKVDSDADAVFASVLDGHAGWEVAEYVNKHLVKNAATLLGNASSNDFTHSSLSSAFVGTDDALRARLLRVFLSGHGKANRVGACTMLAYAKGSTLVVANGKHIIVQCPIHEQSS
ncbi:hypothetical protein DYB37_013543 [Aphanomyces astaci]|uniref:PPM-type phosphatase domain-containing protein n=1 Tax=Aphanomyces astaci TaxID=112090 RepID=A0A3R7CRT4_APHAT|nr:hypothetical protein DYB35_013037 [Aphanomyces astaci]RHZ34738.1 hypothetical protein DYB37_013543 [Aphanomyces astaci]